MRLAGISGFLSDLGFDSEQQCELEGFIETHARAIKRRMDHGEDPVDILIDLEPVAKSFIQSLMGATPYDHLTARADFLEATAAAFLAREIEKCEYQIRAGRIM